MDCSPRTIATCLASFYVTCTYKGTSISCIPSIYNRNLSVGIAGSVTREEEFEGWDMRTRSFTEKIKTIGHFLIGLVG